MVMNCLKKYEINSGQIINKEKSYFIMSDKTSKNRVKIVADILPSPEKGISYYLFGMSPIPRNEKKIEYFADMATKILKKVSSLNYSRLSIGGKVTLIKHVVGAMPVHLMSICQPPKAMKENVNTTGQIGTVYVFQHWKVVLVSDLLKMFQNLLPQSSGGSSELKTLYGWIL